MPVANGPSEVVFVAECYSKLFFEIIIINYLRVAPFPPNVSLDRKKTTLGSIHCSEHSINTGKDDPVMVTADSAPFTKQVSKSHERKREGNTCRIE